MKRLPPRKKGLIAPLLAFCCLAFTCPVTAQTYQPGVGLDDSLVVFVKKCTFPQAGEKLMTVSVEQDTTAKSQAITVHLYNPDLSLYRTFGTTRPMTDWIMYMHNGMDVIEHQTNGLPVYYWMLTSVSDLDTTYTNYTTVFDESNRPLLTLPVSFHGHQTFISDGRLKIAGDRVTWDTIHYTNDEWTGWYTMQYATTSIYDVANKVKEATFPLGTRLKRVLTVNDSLLLFTENVNMTYYLDEHPKGSKATCLNMTVYGADYQPIKTLDFDIDLFGAPNKEAINFVTAWEPLFDGERLFFAHQMNYYIKDDQGLILENRDRIFLTDANGQPIANSHKTDNYPTEAIWLPNRKENAFMSYNGLVMNGALDSLLSCNEAVMTESDSVLFIQQLNTDLHIYDETFTRIQTLTLPEGNWTYNNGTQFAVNNDSLIELIFTDWNNGLCIINEQGKVLVNAPELHALLEIGAYKPLTVREKDQRYANILDEDHLLWQRKAILSAKAVIGEATMPLRVQLFELINGQPVLKEASAETGLFDTSLPEGAYVLRTQPKDQYPGTYYPSGLLWEEAKVLSFTTDSAVSVTISQLPALPTMSTLDAGVIHGTILHIAQNPIFINAPASHRSSAPQSPFEQAHIYLKRVDDQALTAQSAVNIDTYRMENLPLGHYQVLVDMPGKPMLETALVQLTETNKTISLNFLVDTGGIRVGYNSAIQSIKTADFTVYPNPAIDHLQFDSKWEGCRLDVCDLSGRLLQSTTITNSRVGVSALMPGLYLLRLHTPEGIHTTRLIKH